MPRSRPTRQKRRKSGPSHRVFGRPVRPAAEPFSQHQRGPFLVGDIARTRAEAESAMAEARKSHERLREAGLEAQDPERAYVLDLVSADVAAAKHEEAAADRDYASALDRAVRANRPDDTVRAASSYVGFLLDQGRIDDARQIAGRLAVHADGDFRAARAMALLYAVLGDAKSAEETRRRAVGLAGQRTL